MREKLQAVRNEYCGQISKFEEIYEASGHELYKKDQMIFLLVEQMKAFVQAIDWILMEDV